MSTHTQKRSNVPTFQRSNAEIANQLDEIARLLEIQGANPFRVRAYRDAAVQVRAADRPLAGIVRDRGPEALEEIPDIGESLAAVIAEIVRQGRSNLLDRLRSDVEPTAVFEQLPGIGDELAQRIVDHLDVTTLPELEQAAHDGRLAQVPGFGDERVRNVQIALAGLLSPSARLPLRSSAPQPPVGLLLEIDKLYRQRAAAGELRKIAPKRFNPDGEAWLPIMELDRAGWHFTALYSNTARAHELDKTHDWVVIYYQRRDRREDGAEDQCTVVTETHGPLEGQRVVRGREPETRRYYQQQTPDDGR